jgi:MFS family permease
MAIKPGQNEHASAETWGVTMLSGGMTHEDTSQLAREGDVDAGLEKQTVGRITRRLIPFLILCYFIASLNRVNVSFAALQMNKQLGLSGAVYGFGAGLFFITYCLCEVPSNLLLHKFGARRWIARIMLSWGVCACAMAFVQGPISFYAVRLLLGAAEAGFYPGVLFFITLWFPAAYRGRIFGLFVAAIPLSGIIGAPLSGMLMGLEGVGGLHGWQWMFLLEGLPAVLLAPVVLWYLTDTPGEAGWLPAPEGRWLSATLRGERSATETRRRYSVIQALTNPWVLFLAAMYFTNVCLMNSITFFLPQIVKGFGLTIQQTGFVVAIPSLFALAGVIWWGRRSDARHERTGHAAFANFIGGAALLASVLVHDPIWRCLVLSLALAATLSFFSPFWAIPGSFLSGAAAAGGIAAISALGVIGGFVSPWIVGALRDYSGDFRTGLGSFAVLAMVASIIFYIAGRRRQTAAAS